MPKVRECAVYWNGLKNQGQWELAGQWPPIDNAGISLVIPMIEKSAYDELEAKLNLAVEALEYLVNAVGCDQSGCAIKWRMPTEALAKIKDETVR